MFIKSLRNLIYGFGAIKLMNIGSKINTEFEFEKNEFDIKSKLKDNNYVLFYNPNSEQCLHYMKYFEENGFKIMIVDSKNLNLINQLNHENIVQDDQKLNDLDIEYIFFDNIADQNNRRQQALFIHEMLKKNQKAEFINLTMQNSFIYIDNQKYQYNLPNAKFSEKLFESLYVENFNQRFRNIKVCNLISKSQENYQVFGNYQLLTESPKVFIEGSMKRLYSDCFNYGTIKTSLTEYFLSARIFQM